MQVAPSPSKCQAGDAGFGNHTQSRGQTKRLRLAVELPQRQARLGAHSPPGRIDPYAFHSRHVDHEAPIAYGFPRNAVASAPYGHENIMFAGKMNARDHIGSASAPRNDR